VVKESRSKPNSILQTAIQHSGVSTYDTGSQLLPARDDERKHDGSQVFPARDEERKHNSVQETCFDHIEHRSLADYEAEAAAELHRHAVKETRDKPYPCAASSILQTAVQHSGVSTYGAGSQLLPARDEERKYVDAEDKPLFCDRPLRECIKIDHNCVLGEGGFAIVYRALDKRNGRTVALKQMKPDERGRLDRDKMVSEVEIIKQCKGSDYIVECLDAWFLDTVWISMEYCCGGSVRDCMRLRRNPGPLKERQIAVVCYQVAEALHFLDSKKLIHRDVKAVNIMVDGEGHVKLSDFGESYIKEYTMDLATTQKGSVHWMAPEMTKEDSEREYDSKVDIWSLGITAMEMALEYPPNFQVKPEQLLTRMRQFTPEPPVLPKQYGGWVFSPAFRDFIEMCLQNEPSDREPARELLKCPFIKSGKAQKNAVTVELRNLAQNEIRPKLEGRKEESQRRLSIARTTLQLAGVMQ